LLTFKNVENIVNDLREFFPDEYQTKRFNTKGEREYPYVLLTLMEDTELYFVPLGYIFDYNEDTYGCVSVTLLLIDICTKDLLGSDKYSSGRNTGDSEVRYQVSKLREHISINWNSLLDRTEIKQPLNIQRLSGILTPIWYLYSFVDVNIPLSLWILRGCFISVRSNNEFQLTLI
jgi:hypothetical protein